MGIVKYGKKAWEKIKKTCVQETIHEKNERLWEEIQASIKNGKRRREQRRKQAKTRKQNKKHRSNTRHGRKSSNRPGCGRTAGTFEALKKKPWFYVSGNDAAGSLLICG